MKRYFAFAVVFAMCVTLAACAAGCFETVEPIYKQADFITVVTTYGGDDGNRENYVAAIHAYEAATGIRVEDASQSSDEDFKAKVKTDFEVGSEPDVLFFFTGTDADSFVQANKVVSIDEIRSVYPNYAANMKDELLPRSTYDDKAYAVPVNGFWEGLFVNKKILAETGVSFPDENYTWDQFLADCEKIKQAGYIPVDLSVNGLPHYWWEFAVMNNGTLSNHLELADSIHDHTGRKWLGAIADIKQLYDLGYLPNDTLSTTGTDPYGSGGYFREDGTAAFAIDGSWYLGGIISNIENGTLANYEVEDFGVTYVPAKGDRKATEIISGISSGYYITRRAWEDDTRRDAVVAFVTAMTTDEVVWQFSRTSNSLTALKNGSSMNDLNALEQSAAEMCAGVTGSSGALQDVMGEVKARVFSELSSVVGGNRNAEDMLAYAISG